MGMKRMGTKNGYGGVWNERFDMSIERWSVGMKRMGMKDRMMKDAFNGHFENQK